jgi:ribosomal protein S27E
MRQTRIETGKWFSRSINGEHFLAIRCEKCQNVMRSNPGQTVTCGRDGQTYVAPASFRGINPMVTLQDLRQQRRERIAPIEAHKQWQKEQGFGVTERKWRERMHQIEKEESKAAQ